MDLKVSASVTGQLHFKGAVAPATVKLVLAELPEVQLSLGTLLNKEGGEISKEHILTLFIIFSKDLWNYFKFMFEEKLT